MAFAFVANSVKAYPEGAESPFRNCFEQVLEFNVTAVNTDQELDLAAIAALDAANGPQVLSTLAKVSRMNGCLALQASRATAGAYASGNATITNVANLIAAAGDTITVAGVGFVAQAAAVVAGEETFQAITSVTITAASLAAQINAHATTSALVTATPALGVVTITAKQRGAAGNDVTLVYTDAGANVGATVSGATLTGGLPTAGYSIHGTAKAPVFAFPGSGDTPTALHFVLRFRLGRDETPFIYNAV
jgi:hypothetical protein